MERGREEGVPEFDAVFHVLLPRAKRVAHRILGDVHEAEDAAVEALAQAALQWNRIGALPPHRRDAWIMRVTSNVAFSELRRRIRRRRPLPTDRPADGTEAMYALDVHDALIPAIAMLPRRQREVLALRFLEGFSVAETGGVLGISEGNVKKTTSDALHRLRRSLGDDVEFLGGTI